MAKRHISSSAGENGDRLIERARDGDQAAWADLVCELGPTVRGFARAKGVPHPDDLTQDVFVVVASGLDHFAGDWPAFRSWLFGIAYRKIVDTWRKSGREQTRAELPRQMADPIDPGPEEEVVTGTVALDAMAALDALNETERDVVLLRVIAGLDTSEVASVVDKRPGNVRVIQSRALKKLRSELERRGYGDPRPRAQGSGKP